MSASLSNTFPGKSGPENPPGSVRPDVVRILAPVRRHIGLSRVLHGMLAGFAVGAVGGVMVLLAVHLRAFDNVVPLAWLAIGLGVLGGILDGLRRWPRAEEAARVADQHFDLHERLTTALELRSSNHPLAALQRRDMDRRIEGLPLGQSGGSWARWIDVAIVLGAAFLFVLALALGAPGNTRARAALGPSDLQRLHRQTAHRVQQLASQLNQGLTQQQLKSGALRKLDLALARLQRQLLHASSRTEALRALSTTQQQLRQLAAGFHPINQKAVAQLNRSLGKYLNGTKVGNQAKPSARSAAATSQAMKRLAQSLTHLTAAQRAAVARTLAQAANTSSNNTLRSGLRQAASALAYNNARAAQNALRQLSKALAQTPSAQAALSRLASAASQMDTIKNQIAGITGYRPIAQRGQSGRQGRSGQQGQAAAAAGKQAGGQQSGRGQGARSTSGNGVRAGNGRGRNGQGTLGGTPRGRGQGSVANRRGSSGRGRAVGSRPGSSTLARGRAGGHSNGGGSGQPGSSRAGQNTTVYVPGKQGRGAELVQQGPKGAPQPGAVVPYQQVVGRYTTSAHQALDRAQLPPSLQGYVRRYFSAISR